MREDQPDFDETVAVAATEETIVQAAASVNDLTVAVNDDTVVVNLVEANDETIVVNAAISGDETVVAPNRPPDDDATVVATEYSVRAELSVDSSLEAVQHSVRGADSLPRRSQLRRGIPEESYSPAPPIAEPTSNRSISALFGRGAGLDPERPIAPVPGTTPWDAPTTGTRGVAQGIPVSYGARMRTEAEVYTGIDEVQRKLGVAPQAHPVVVREGRNQLPSLQRLDQRRRVTTLVVYAGVTVACVFGIWGVATIAFG